MAPGEVFGNEPGFVGVNGANEVPADLRGHSLDFVQGILEIVFAKVPKAGLDRDVDFIGSSGLAYR